jgi:hypothetical protein
VRYDAQFRNAVALRDAGGMIEIVSAAALLARLDGMRAAA